MIDVRTACKHGCSVSSFLNCTREGLLYVMRVTPYPLASLKIMCCPVTANGDGIAVVSDRQTIDRDRESWLGLEPHTDLRFREN